MYKKTKLIYIEAHLLEACMNMMFMLSITIYVKASDAKKPIKKAKRKTVDKCKIHKVLIFDLCT